MSNIMQLVETLDENQINSGDIFSYINQVRSEKNSQPVEEEKKEEPVKKLICKTKKSEQLKNIKKGHACFVYGSLRPDDDSG